MRGDAGAILRAGLGLKAAQLRRATQSYIEDRTDHGKSIAAGYATGAGLYAAAGVFMIAACLVGIAALFRWIELNYGQFTAFGFSIGILIVLTALCALIAASSMRPPKPKYPGLGTRLSAALKGNPLKTNAANIKALSGGALAARSTGTRQASSVSASRHSSARPDAMETARSAAADVLRAPAAPLRRNRAGYGAASGPLDGRAALVLVATLLGWAVARRHSNARKPASNVRTAA